MVIVKHASYFITILAVISTILVSGCASYPVTTTTVPTTIPPTTVSVTTTTPTIAPTTTELMITIYCTDSSCAAQQVSAGAGTLVQGCYRSLEQCNAPSTAQVTISGFSFQPSEVTIKAGGSVTWTNQDSPTHTVVSDSGEFNSSSLPTGQSYTHAFPTAGTYAYHCGIHPSMTGTVIVV